MNENAVNTPAAAETEQTEATAPEKALTDSEKKALREEGKRALLEELGVTDCKTAKEGLEAYRKSVEANKSDIEKEREARAAAEQTAADNLKRAEHYEACITAIKGGANAETVDDLVTIAAAKAAEKGESIEAVIDTLKNSPAYSGFFSPAPVQGMGNPVGIKRPQTGMQKESLGARLANAQKSAMTAENPYFK